jgi:6-pyruvoyl-tetrahydropterin synthase related domain
VSKELIPAICNARIKSRDILIIAVISVVLALPMLVYGPMLRGDDTFEHLNFSKNFTGQFWAGEFYPRWLSGLNHGLGSPAFFVYGPLPYYVSALLEPVGRLFRFSAFDVSDWLALFGSGICALLWLSTMVPGRSALLGSILYMTMPYHLWADFYRRFALAECWAMVWMPLILYFTARVVARKPRAMVGLAVAFALLIASHLFTVLMFSLVPLAAAIFLSSEGKKFQAASRVAVSMLLGVGLSSAYLVPALFHQKHIPAAKLIMQSDYNWADNFLRFGRELFARPATASFVRPVSWIALNLFVLAIVCGGLVLKQSHTGTKKTIIFWLGVCALSIFMMSSLSVPLWRLLPSLQAIQFPWRFNVVLCVAALPVMAIFLSSYSWNSLSSKIAVSACLFVILVPWLLAQGDIWRRYRTETLPVTYVASAVEHDGLFQAWSPPGTDQASSLRASSEPRVRFMEGEGSAEVLSWRPRHIQFQTSSPEGGWVMVNQFYYPAWKARIAGQPTSIRVRPSIPEGLVQLLVPPGVQRVLLDIPVGFAERAGYWISVLCLLLCGYFVFRSDARRFGRNHRETRAGGGVTPSSLSQLSGLAGQTRA